MAKEGTVAPKERVNIVYRPATGDRQGGSRTAVEVVGRRRIFPRRKMIA